MSPSSPGSRPGSDEVSLARQLAHDARSPISALVVLSSSLLDEVADTMDELPRYHLELIHNAALSLDTLMADLADLGRVGHLVGPGSRASFSLKDLVGDVRNLLLPLAELRDVSINVRSGEPDRRTGFPSAIRRALLGLASHPLRMGGEYPLEISALPSDGATGDEITFAVRTESPGLEVEVVEAVAEVARGERSRGRSSFAHLGVELSIHLLESMNAPLRIEEEASGGMSLSFELELPVADRS